jgi:DNA topoisomerase-6 subunit B
VYARQPLRDRGRSGVRARPEQAQEDQQKKAVPLAEGEADQGDDRELARVIRYANRVPLLYQQSACAIFKSVLETTWRNYGVTQSRGALFSWSDGDFHMASVWVPFTSESKEAIAEYDEIGKEITLALRECGRRLGAFLRRRERAHSEQSRRNIFELYIEEVVESCNRLKGGRLPVAKLKEQLQKMAMKRTGGEKTDEVLGKNGHAPEGLPHSIIVTADGVEGEVPTVIAPPVTVAPANGNGHPAAEEKNESQAAAKGRRGAKARHETVGRTVHEKTGRKAQKESRSRSD